MSVAAKPTTQPSVITVALIGNPNTGKSSLFSALAGIHQRVGNYPGVTVEKKIGQMTVQGQAVELIDLPGTYSLSARSPDEMIAVDVLLGRVTDVALPDLVLCIVDASNLPRNLYLASQLLELGLPTIVVVNMMDLADRKGLRINIPLLQQRLGVPVIVTQAHRRVGITELRAALVRVAREPVITRPSPLPAVLRDEVQRLSDWITAAGHQPLPRYWLERLVLDVGGGLESSPELQRRVGLSGEMHAARDRMEQAGLSLPAAEAMARYDWVGRVLEGVVEEPLQTPADWSARLDRVLTHRIWGTLAFVLVMIVIFQAVFSGAAPAMDGVEWLVGGLGDLVGSWLPTGPLRDLVVNGIVAGVGAVLIFLPQILLLFFFVAILEDCGYLARTAYLMDRIMVQLGLSGKSFIPLLSSFACAVPGIMATRTIENRRDRLLTILIAPLMSCSARLPVYTLFIGAFIPARDYLGGWMGLQGLTLVLMYSVGIVAAVVISWILGRTVVRGETPPFVMELPRYTVPSPRVVLMRVVESGWSFVRRAGTLILATSVVVWALSYYPRGIVDANPSGGMTSAAADADLAARHMRESYLGRLGQWIEPAVRPLGWDWRIGCAVLASFPAREVVISTLGVLYQVGEDADAGSAPLRERLRTATWEDTGERVFGVPVALSVMVFFALCAQCVSTLAVIRRETDSWRWPLFTFVYMTTLAYLGALAAYQVAFRLGW